MSASEKSQYYVGQHVRGKGIYFGTAEIVSGLNFNMYADFQDVTVQDLMKTRGSKQAVGPRAEKFLLNAFRNAVHALNNAALPDIERIKDRPKDAPNIPYETELMRRLSQYRSGDLSGRFIPNVEMFAGVNKQVESTGQPSILGSIWKNKKSNTVLGHTPYHTCTEALLNLANFSGEDTIGFHLRGLSQIRGSAYLGKNTDVAHIRLVRVECV